MTPELRTNIIKLCHKVKEVINNNDWPTEEGHNREDLICPLENLVNNILIDLGNTI